MNLTKKYQIKKFQEWFKGQCKNVQKQQFKAISKYGE